MDRKDQDAGALSSKGLGRSHKSELHSQQVGDLNSSRFLSCFVTAESRDEHRQIFIWRRGGGFIWLQVHHQGKPDKKSRQEPGGKNC